MSTYNRFKEYGRKFDEETFGFLPLAGPREISDIARDYVDQDRRWKKISSCFFVSVPTEDSPLFFVGTTDNFVFVFEVSSNDTFSVNLFVCPSNRRYYQFNTQYFISDETVLTGGYVIEKILRYLDDNRESFSVTNVATTEFAFSPQVSETENAEKYIINSRITVPRNCPVPRGLIFRGLISFEQENIVDKARMMSEGSENPPVHWSDLSEISQKILNVLTRNPQEGTITDCELFFCIENVDPARNSRKYFYIDSVFFLINIIDNIYVVVEYGKGRQFADQKDVLSMKIHYFVSYQGALGESLVYLTLSVLVSDRTESVFEVVPLGPLNQMRTLVEETYNMIGYTNGAADKSQKIKAFMETYPIPISFPLFEGVDYGEIFPVVREGILFVDVPIETV